MVGFYDAECLGCLGHMLCQRCPVINDDQCLSEDISMKTTRPKQSLSLRMA